ncbi:MAG TPA: hypothetical protein DEP91_04385 [Sphingomonas bacterium]|jgi:uncharacterized protein (TIGR02594 family)|uniref:Peptidase C51 domain-containing protein n=1 Tax=Sphingomonas bacterium TaxID=1895847 RepID=A0A3D0W9Q9_9SPHN|nr:hypothetical protein [Sphingomonas bacterium]
MSNVDIVARLQLRADQFSSETGARFAELRTRAKSTAQAIRTDFNASFADVRKIAEQALTIPRTATGSLDLSGEIGSLRQAAAASDARAASLREMQQAMLGAAAAGRGNIEVLRLDADAAMVAAAAEERLASEARQRIVTLEAVQGQLRASTVTTTELTRAGGAYVVSAGQQRAAMQNLGFQLQDFTVQVVSGQSAFTAFAQQLPQAAGSLSGFGGQVGRVGAALSSFGGVAAVVAVTALVPLIAKLLEGGDATEKLVKKMREDALESRRAADAKVIYEKSLDGVIDKQRALNDELEREIKTRQQLDQGRLDQSRQSVVDIRQGLDAQKQEVERARRDLMEARRQATTLGVGSIAPGQSQAAAAELVRAEQRFRAQVDRYNSILREGISAQDDERRAQIPLLRRQVTEATDAVAAATGRYERQLASLNEQFVARRINESEYRKRLAAEERTLEAAREAARADKRKPRATSIGNQLESERGSEILAAAQRYVGTREDTRAGRATLKDLFSTSGMNVDPEKVAWCAAFVNAVLAGQGIKGTGSLSARSFLGFGENTDSPNKGDIVVLRRGNNAAQGHVGFYSGTDSKGRVLVTGGNQGDSVSTQAFARRDVLGFRRAPSAADSYKAQEEAAKRLAAEAERAYDAVDRINATWDEQPRLIDRARLDAGKLRDVIADFEGRIDPATGKLDENAKAIVAAARASLSVIEQGLNRPYEQFVRSQREGLAIQHLILQGRDVEAVALQDALRLQEAGQQLDEQRLRDLYAMAAQQKAIADALEDQRRVVGVYVGTVGDLQRTFDDFLASAERRPGKALEGLLTGTADAFKQMQRNLLSESLFGGLDRAVEDYVRRRSGGTTPADMLKEQLGSAGRVLGSHADDAGRALEDFAATVRRVSAELGTAPQGAPFASAQAASLIPADFSDELIRSLRDRPATGLAANDNGDGADIVVTASARALDNAASALGDKAGIAGVVIDHFADRLGRLGIEVPQNITDALKTHLPTVIDGLNLGQAGGSIFAAIGGGKNDKLASGVGGILGNVAGKALGGTITKAIGGSLGKAIGGAAGPIGSILGGIAGNLISGLFRKSTSGSAGITTNQYGNLAAGGASGTSAQLSAQASSLAGAVASGLEGIAKQLGAKITGSSDVRIGTYKDMIRVNTTGKAIGGVKGSGAITFATEEEAIRFAISDALKDGVLSGISDASLAILRSGQNLEQAIEKASLIESVPKMLKQRLDPVGAAVDEVTERFDKIFAALKEGGAGAAQMAQAQQLYNLELADAKTRTSNAAAGLKSFLEGLKAGNASPLSLRDQETAARAALQPYLDQIASGQSIDQDKYQQAAQTFLDVERQLYGSTNAFFVEFDRIQKATASAIERIDNASSIGSSDALARAAADSAAKTAAAVQTGNEMAESTNDLLARMVALQEELVRRAGSSGGDFIGAARGFASAA